MVYVLNATLFKPINQILAAREKRTRGRLTEAQEILGNVSEKLSRYERALRAARTESYAFTEQERAGAMEDRQRQLDKMRVQLAASTASEKEKIQHQAEQARATLENDARQIAVEIGSRVLSRPVRGADLN
jgi:F0F1-type ATP synthase membrane subunit b/b'